MTFGMRTPRTYFPAGCTRRSRRNGSGTLASRSRLISIRMCCRECRRMRRCALTMPCGWLYRSARQRAFGSNWVANGEINHPSWARICECSQRLGEVAEWLKAPHSKCGVLARVSGVRIPPSPPNSIEKFIEIGLFKLRPPKSTPAVQALQGTDLAEVEATLLGKHVASNGLHLRLLEYAPVLWIGARCLPSKTGPARLA